MTIEEIYQQHCILKSDINEHLPLLREYASRCSSITEMGVRWIVSTWAFVVAKPQKITSIDINHPKTWNAQDKFNTLVEKCIENNIDFEFIQADTRKIKIKKTDFLFIDTLHNYEQIKEELKLHSQDVNKYIAFHDTESYAKKDEVGNGRGILPAIKEFLLENANIWKIVEDRKNNNGLLIIEREINE